MGRNALWEVGKTAQMLSSRPEATVTSWGRVLIPLCALGVACNGGAVVSLGDAQPPLYHFGAPRELAELGPTFENENPTLTGDLLELYFTSSRGTTSGDVWSARRASRQVVFDSPTREDVVSTPLFETSAAISVDGLSLYVGSDRAGGLGDLDVWMSTRPSRAAPWSAPEDLVAINTIGKDVPRPPGQQDRVMPLSSDRDSPTAYQTFLAARPDPAGVFGTPAIIPELTFPGRTTVDAFLSADGLTLFFASSPTGGKLDLFVAWRKATSVPFTIYVPLDDLNTAGDERDPWLSPDGTVFYFTSDRGGALDIYEAPVTRGPSAGR
jgi:hypothetical protein